MTPLVRNGLFALGLAIILWLAYTMFFQNLEPLVVDNPSDPALVTSQDLLSNLQKLKAARISSDVFSDARFQSLVDLRQEIHAEPVGRANPFSPVNPVSLVNPVSTN